ncbi:MAG: DUF1679 domain-containing protein, partial [Deltaproteobacteria bacterium]
MSKKIGIPESPEVTTSAWLTEALRSTKTIDQAVVKSFKMKRIGEKEGFTGSLVRFEIDYSQSEKTAPTSLVGKFSSPDPEVRASSKPAYEREVRFYNEIAIERNLPVPQCYYSDIEPETGVFIILLEDLSHLRTVEFVTGCNPTDMELVIEEMARMQASWWNSPKLEEMSWLLSLADYPYQEWWSQYPQEIADLFPDHQLPDTFFDVGYRFGSNMETILNQLEGAPLTCIHRDIHVDNLLFGVQDTDPRLTVVDWQITGKGRGVSDVAYFLISSIPSAQRRQSEVRLLETYHTLLTQNGVKNYSFEQCWLDYKLS